MKATGAVLEVLLSFKVSVTSLLKGPNRRRLVTRPITRMGGRTSEAELLRFQADRHVVCFTGVVATRGGKGEVAALTAWGDVR